MNEVLLIYTAPHFLIGIFYIKESLAMPSFVSTIQTMNNMAGNRRTPS